MITIYRNKDNGCCCIYKDGKREHIIGPNLQIEASAVLKSLGIDAEIVEIKIDPTDQWPESEKEVWRCYDACFAVRIREKERKIEELQKDLERLKESRAKLGTQSKGLL